jgi:hypothetical protein
MKYSLIALSLLSSLTVGAFAQDAGPAPTPRGAAATSQLFSAGREPKRIDINNRIIAKVNGKAISVFDIMKKMDVVFYQQFPQFSDSLPARFQFYSVNWKHVLQDLIDKELILADATEMKMEVSQGDIRQEMEEWFGPNILNTLDKLSLSYKEAWDMVANDMTMRRMLGARVNMQVLARVNPGDVRSAYEKFCEENNSAGQWTYQVVTLRHPDENEGRRVAELACEWLLEQKCSLVQLKERLQQLEAPSTVTCHISEEYQHEGSLISPAYMAVLEQMQPGTFSKPVAQTSRAQGGVVHRIFFLKDKTEGGVAALNEVEDTLKNQLISDAVSERTTAYLKRLRDHFDVNEESLQQMVPQDFEPFILY